MRKEYDKPEFEMVRIDLSKDVLNPSDPEPTVPGGGGGSSDDPFEEL